jgi:hypothetical protein
MFAMLPGWYFICLALGPWLGDRRTGLVDKRGGGWMDGTKLSQFYPQVSLLQVISYKNTGHSRMKISN